MASPTSAAVHPRPPASKAFSPSIPEIDDPPSGVMQTEIATPSSELGAAVEAVRAAYGRRADGDARVPARPAEPASIPVERTPSKLTYAPPAPDYDLDEGDTQIAGASAPRAVISSSTTQIAMPFDPKVVAAPNADSRTADGPRPGAARGRTMTPEGRPAKVDRTMVAAPGDAAAILAATPAPPPRDAAAPPVEASAGPVWRVDDAAAAEEGLTVRVTRIDPAKDEGVGPTWRVENPAGADEGLTQRVIRIDPPARDAAAAPAWRVENPAGADEGLTQRVARIDSTSLLADAPPPRRRRIKPWMIATAIALSGVVAATAYALWSKSKATPEVLPSADAAASLGEDTPEEDAAPAAASESVDEPAPASDASQSPVAESGADEHAADAGATDARPADAPVDDAVDDAPAPDDDPATDDGPATDDELPTPDDADPAPDDASDTKPDPAAGETTDKPRRPSTSKPPSRPKPRPKSDDNKPPAKPTPFPGFGPGSHVPP